MDWKIFLSTFGLLFLAELGDKTQLAVISLVSKHRSPGPVFIGAVAALAVVTLLGVLAGEALLSFIPCELLRKGAAGLFVIVGILMWFDCL
ncbi:MAG: TMEM165/GDT1 family protein [Anaerolineae bacterium]